MNIVIHTFNNINGGTYDSIEYSYILSKLSDTTLIIISDNNNTKNLIKNCIDYKYKFSIDDFNIKILTKQQSYKYFLTNTFNSVLCIDSLSIQYLSIIKSNKKIILGDYYKDNLNLFNNIKKLKNIKVFNEIPGFPSEVNYKFKFLFDLYKTYNYLEDNTLISYKGNMNNKLHNTKFINNKTGKEIIFEWPIDNFNQKFNRYEVYSLSDWFDPRPRIYVECLFYGITLDNIIRHIDKENYDGAYYRLKDLKDNGLKNRYLSYDDEIISFITSDKY